MQRHATGKTILTQIQFPILLKRYLKGLAGTRGVSFKSLIMDALETAYPCWRDQLALDIDEEENAYISKAYKDHILSDPEPEVIEEDATPAHKATPYNPHAGMYEKPEQARGYHPTKGIRSKGKFFLLKPPTPPTPERIEQASQETDNEYERMRKATKAKRDAEDAEYARQLGLSDAMAGGEENSAYKQKTPLAKPTPATQTKPKPHQKTRLLPAKTPKNTAKKRRAK